MQEIKRLCGARLWIDWTNKGPVVDRLFEYTGTAHVNGEVVYAFHPYKRKGYPLLMTFQQLNLRLNYFKPFLIDNQQFAENIYA